MKAAYLAVLLLGASEWAMSRMVDKSTSRHVNGPQPGFRSCWPVDPWTRRPLRRDDLRRPIPQPRDLDALIEAYPAAVLGNRDDAASFLSSSEQAIELTVAPAEMLAENVVGITIGTGTSANGWRFEKQLFRWDGSNWLAATPDETGVPVTTAVS